MKQKLKKQYIVLNENVSAYVTTVKGEKFLKVTFKGVSEQAYKKDPNYWEKQTQYEVNIPFWDIPGSLRLQREAIARHAKQVLNEIENLKEAYNTEVY